MMNNRFVSLLLSISFFSHTITAVGITDDTLALNLGGERDCKCSFLCDFIITQHFNFNLNMAWLHKWYNNLLQTGHAHNISTLVMVCQYFKTSSFYDDACRYVGGLILGQATPKSLKRAPFLPRHQVLQEQC